MEKYKCIAIYITICYNMKERRQMLKFEWDENKERINIEKHGIDFSTAALVFGDNSRLEKYDNAHSTLEERYITIGQIGQALVIVVVYTERGDAIRVISARFATRHEKEAYYGYH